MSLQTNSSNLWICRLGHKDMAAWSRGLLDQKAKALGIKGWIVPIATDNDGNLIEPRWNRQNNRLLAAPCLDLKYPLSPSREIKLASQLKAWWEYKDTLNIIGKKFLVLKGIQNLSHPHFSLRRLKLSLADTWIAGTEYEWITKKQQSNIDCLIQTIPSGSKKKPANYLQNLKNSHHEMKLDGIWIPSVKGLTQEEEPLWCNASASRYHQWVLQASAWSRIRYLKQKEAPLCIDSWESHQRWWKQDTITSKAKAHITQHSVNPEPVIHAWGNRSSENIAIMIHGFYVDKLQDILSRMPPGGHQNGIPGLDLYVSTPLNRVDEVQELLAQQSWPRVYICGATNRGRDIAPFLINLLPEALRTGHYSFIKLHTKKSPHLKAGHDWSNHLLTSLLNNKLMSKLDDAVRTDPELGLYAPPGTLLKSSIALGCNAEHLEMLLEKMKWDGAWALAQSYVAGSMMAGRLSTMKSLEQLELTIDNFETEQGQTDGTLAHALERLMSWQYANQGLTIKALPGESPSVPEFGFGWV